MPRKPQPAQPGDRARIEVVFDRPQLLGAVFGHYDQNLVAIEKCAGGLYRSMLRYKPPAHFSMATRFWS